MVREVQWLQTRRVSNVTIRAVSELAKLGFRVEGFQNKRVAMSRLEDLFPGLATKETINEWARQGARTIEDMPPHALAALDEMPFMKAVIAYRKGAAVTLVGLKTQELNGQSGVVVKELSAATGRIGVKLASRRVVAVKPANLSRT